MMVGYDKRKSALEVLGGVFFEKKEMSYFFIFKTLAFFAAFRRLGRHEFLGGSIVFGETSYK